MENPLLYKNPEAKKRFRSKIGSGVCYLVRQNKWYRCWAVVGGKIISISSTSVASKGDDSVELVLAGYTEYVKDLIRRF